MAMEDRLSKGYVELRQQLRDTLYPFWPNNPGVGDDEIVDAVKRLHACFVIVCNAFISIEEHCTCGARPESLITHPHVIGCRIGQALVDIAVAAEIQKRGYVESCNCDCHTDPDRFSFRGCCDDSH